MKKKNKLKRKKDSKKKIAAVASVLVSKLKKKNRTSKKMGKMQEVAAKKRRSNKTHKTSGKKLSKKMQEKRKKRTIPSQKLLADFFKEEKKFEKHFSRVYRRIKRWEKIFDKIEKAIERFFKFVFWFSYRAAIFSIVAILIYAITPGALSAPESRTVTNKAEWEAGTLSNVSTFNANDKRDAIQLSPQGTWTARVWEPAPDTISVGHSSTTVGTDIYAFRGYADSAFWKYDSVNNTWHVLAEAPFPAYYGADMSYNGHGYIYAIFGGYSKKAYKYSIANNQWTSLPDLPDTVYSGAAIETDGTDFYVTRGNGANDFWILDVSLGTNGQWISSTAPCNVTTGGSLVNGQDGYMYLVCGGRTNYNFYRYQIDTSGEHNGTWSAWTTMLTGYGLEGENKGVLANGFLYFMTYNYALGPIQYFFVRYDLSGHTWTALERPPSTVNFASLDYNETDHLIYAFRSNGSSDLWKFNPSVGATGKWVGPEQVMDSTITLNTGSDLIWNGGSGASNFIYATRGNTANFYRYDVTNNDWVEKDPVPSSVGGRDMKGTYCNGAVYFLQGTTPYTAFYRYTEDDWETLDTQPFPAASSHGSALTCASDGTIYAIQGGTTQNFYSYTPGGGWDTSLDKMIVGGVTYYAYQGARIVAKGTDIYVMLGDGETTFLKYSGGDWSKVAPTPFAQYYGTDMTYDSVNGKIYALAGYYKNETWEYDPSNGALGTWRRLPDNQEYLYGRGPYGGASIEYAGGTSLYATTGQGFADMWSYSIGATNYSQSPTVGTYTSDVMDLSDVASWVSFTSTDNKPANTDIEYRTRSGDSAIPDDDWSAWDTLHDGKPNSPTKRYFQVKITLSSTDGANTPTVYDYTVSYNMEKIAPTNPTVISAKSQQIGGEDLSPSPESYVYSHPYFTWPAANTAGGASDSGSGVDGYYVCFALDADCADPEIDGSFQTANSYTVNDALEAGDYHLKIKTKDENDNVSEAIWDAFVYKYDGVTPPLTEEVTDADDFNLGEPENIEVRESSDSMRLEPTAGFWKETRLSAALSTIYTGGEFAYSDCYDEQKCLYTFRGYNTNTFYEYNITTDTWTQKSNAYNNEAVYWGGSLVEGPEGYLYGAKGLGTNQFWRYNIASDLWEVMAVAPKNFTYGSVMAYDGSRYIYAMPGGDDVLMRFDTQANNGSGQWTTTLAAIQFGNPNTNTNSQATSTGADMVYDGRNNLYITQGNPFPYFSKYSIANDELHGETANTWTPQAPAPKSFVEGGSLAYDNENDEIYAMRGNNRSDFYKFNVGSNTWEKMNDTPSSIGYGASLQLVDGNLYALRGAAFNTLYKYNLENNSWESPQRAFFGQSTFNGTLYFGYTYGTAMTNDGNGNVYITRGNYDNTFGKYNTESGTFTELARLPMGAYNGASLAFVDDESAIYYSPGDVRSTESYFYKYDIATNVWSEFTDPPDQTYRGSSMTYDGSRYLYLTRGNNSSTWWRYDSCRGAPADPVCTPGWSSALPTYSGWGQGYGSQIVYKGGIIYATRGENTNTFFACDTTLLPGACWSPLSSLPSGKNVYIGGSLVDGNDGYLYAALGGSIAGQGNGTNQFYRYKISDPSGWEEAGSVPAQVYVGGSAAYENNQIWMTAGTGTNSYGDGLFSYVVGSSANGTGFEKSGTYISEVMNLTSIYEWSNLELKYTLPDNTSITAYTRTSEDGNEWTNWNQANNEHAFPGGIYRYNIVSAPSKYIQVKIELSSSDQIFSPEVDYFKINYYQDIDAPENPTGVSAYSDSGKTGGITTNTWYKHATPYFEWPIAGAEGGASDNTGGSGVAGYYVYFGTSADGEPVAFQEGNTYTASELVSGQTYYLRIQAADNAGNIPDEIYPAFIYKYDNTVPTNPSDISVTPAGYTSADNFVFLWESDAEDTGGSGLKKFQYRTDGDEAGLWYDINDTETVTITLPNSEHTVGAYQGGKNWLYLRTVDNALNESSPISQEFYYSSTAPSPPQNLEVDPEYSASNSFSFSWEEPESFAGESSKIKYYYSVNAKPTRFNVSETPNKAVGPAPFATQKGTNTFYVVAKDESGNIDYGLYASVEFTADTSNPPIPVNVQAFDTSDREAQEYSVAVKWSTPDGIDTSNFAGYAIFRSEDNATFSEVAMTTGSAFVDTGLESKLYYYYVESKDKTNNYSAASSTVNLIPTGRYTSAPKVVQDPSVTIQSFQANFSWATNRICSSFVEYGKTIKLGETTGQVDSMTDHEVLVKGLSADTKYFYRVKFIDPDGNIGTSEIDNFTTLPPPTISEFAVSDIGLSSATVFYKTNTGGTCTLKYGAGAYTTTNEEAAASTSHMTKIESLESSTTYNVMTNCVDGDENTFSSDEYTFTTLRQPVVSEPKVENKENVDIPTVDVFYKTDEATTTLIKFKSSDEGSYHNYLTNDSVTEHQAMIEGLEPAKEYEMILSGISVSGVEAVPQTIKVTTRSDSRPPEVIINRAVGKVNGRGKDAQATVYIKIETNELTTVKINYSKGVTVSGFDQNTNEDAPNTYHMITIPVEAGQVYSYQAEVNDLARNQAMAKPNTIVVEDNKANATEIVTGTFSRQFGWLGTLFRGKK